MQREDAEMRKLREQERIRSGKELQAAERENKMNELKRNVEYRKREKEQDAIARAKIKARLGRSAVHADSSHTAPGP